MQAIISAADFWVFEALFSGVHMTSRTPEWYDWSVFGLRYTARVAFVVFCMLGASCTRHSPLNSDDNDIYTTPQDGGNTPTEVSAPEDGQLSPPRTEQPLVPHVHGTPTVENFDHSLCYYFCHFTGHCAIDFGGKAECYDTCHTMIADGEAGNVACFVANCMNPDKCLEDIPIPKACDAICEDAADCAALAVLGMTPSPESCRIMCAGRAVAIPSFGSALDCMVSPLKQCDLDAALECLSNGATFCPLVCLEVADNPGFENEIDPDCPWNAVYPTKESCFEHCSSLDVDGAYRAMKCFERHECQTSIQCIESSSAPCGDYVDAVHQHCPATAFWPPSVTLAKAACNEVFHGDFIGWPDNVDHFSQCLEAIHCQVQNHFTCLVPPDPRCDAICTAFSACSIMTYSECFAGCSTADDIATVDRVEACVHIGSCGFLAQCIPSGDDEHDSPVDVCTTWCNTASTCGIGSEIPPTICHSDCQGTLDNQDVNPVWQLGCHTGAGCAAFETCLGVPFEIHALCYESCNQSNACHHVTGPWDGGLSACIAFCSGVMYSVQAKGQSPTADRAQCVVDNMDHDCVLPDLSICDP
jgi:hypothetical protein